MPVLEVAKAALVDALEQFGNASSPHKNGRALRSVLDDARAAVAAATGADAADVVFTSGASEGNRWAVDAIARGRPGAKVYFTPLEHPSLLKPLLAAVASSRLARTEDSADADIVVMTAAHNETGIIPERPEARDDALVVVDAAQAIGRIDFRQERADIVTCSAHKLGGVAGVGALILSEAARALPSPWVGGGQEEGRRPGTEPVALIAAFGAACKVIERTRADHRALGPLRDRLEAALVDAWSARVLGRDRPRLDNTSAITVPDVDGDALRMSIDRSGVAVGFGAACSALAPEPSPGLLHLGLDDREARATVRLSLWPGCDDALVTRAIEKLAVALPKRRASRRDQSVGGLPPSSSSD